MSDVSPKDMVRVVLATGFQPSIYRENSPDILRFLVGPSNNYVDKYMLFHIVTIYKNIMRLKFSQKIRTS